MIANRDRTPITLDDRMEITFDLKGIEGLNFNKAEFDYPKENISITRYNSRFTVYIKNLSPKNRVFIKIKNIALPYSEPHEYEDKLLRIEPSVSSFENITAKLIIRTLIEVKSTLYDIPFPCYTYIYLSDAKVDLKRNYVVSTFKNIVPLQIALSTTLIILFRKRNKPWATIILSNIAVFLYIFGGKGWEVQVGEKTWRGYLLALCSPLLHLDYFHLTSNLPFFILTGTLMETWLIKKRTPRRYLKLYFSPFLFTLFFYGIREYFVIEQFLVGLSGIIIAFDTVLIVYIFKHLPIEKLSKIDIIAIFLTGLGFYGLFCWSYQIIQALPYMNELKKREIEIHLIYGLLGYVIGSKMIGMNR